MHNSLWICFINYWIFPGDGWKSERAGSASPRTPALTTWKSCTSHTRAQGGLIKRVHLIKDTAFCGFLSPSALTFLKTWSMQCQKIRQTALSSGKAYHCNLSHEGFFLKSTWQARLTGNGYCKPCSLNTMNRHLKLLVMVSPFGRVLSVIKRDRCKAHFNGVT